MVKDILVQTVHGSVHLTVDLTHVDTQMDLVQPVLQAGWVIIVLKVLFAHNVRFSRTCVSP